MFTKPSAIKGRENELDRLFQKHNEALAGQASLLFIGGSAGIGKTSLVHELIARIETPPTFLQGKFEQFAANEPFSAFNQMVETFFTSLSDKDKKTVWKGRILEYFGNDVGILSANLPSIQKLIGHQPPITITSSDEFVLKSIRLYRLLISLLCEHCQNLVIFLDDLQWADDLSLKLIEQLCSHQKIKGLFLIGAYRDDEIETEGSFNHLLSGLPKTEQLRLSNLPSDQLSTLVEACVDQPVKNFKELVTYTNQTTAGNPFYAIRLVKALIEDSIALTFEEGLVKVNLDAKVFNGTSIVDFVAREIDNLDAKQQALLCTAALLNKPFDFGLMSEITELSTDECADSILPLVSLGLFSSQRGFIQFSHDSIRTAAFRRALSLLRTRDIHYRIYKLATAKRLKKKSTLELGTFEMCNHVNQCSNRNLTKAEKTEKITLNYEAASKAKEFGINSLAYDYLKEAESTLNDVGSSASNQSFNIFIMAAKCAFLLGKDEESEHYFEKSKLAQNSQSDLLTLEKYRIEKMTLAGSYVEALESSLVFLQSQNLELPSISNPNEIEDYLNHLESQLEDSLNLKKIDIAGLYNLPVCEDPVIELLMEILGELYACALMSAPSYLRVITATMVNFSVTHGNTLYSPIAYAWHGSAIVEGNSMFEKAYQFGILAIRLNEGKIKNEAISCKIYNMVGNFIAHFKEPIKATLDMLSRAYDQGIQSGDYLYAGYSKINELRNSYSTGLELGRWLQRDDQAVVDLEACGADVMIEVRESFRANTLRLTGDNGDLSSVNNTRFNESDYLTKYADVPLFACLLNSLKLQSSYILSFEDEALAICSHDMSPIDSFVLGTEFKFFSILTIYKHALDSASSQVLSTYDELIKTNRTDIHTLSQTCPSNYRHLHLFLEGLQRRLDGEIETALNCIVDGIKNAQQYGFTQYQAIGLELASDLAKATGQEERSEDFKRQAIEAYSSWGAHAKVALMTSTQ